MLSSMVIFDEIYYRVYYPVHDPAVCIFRHKQEITSFLLKRIILGKHVLTRLAAVQFPHDEGKRLSSSEMQFHYRLSKYEWHGYSKFVVYIDFYSFRFLFLQRERWGWVNIVRTLSPYFPLTLHTLNSAIWRDPQVWKMQCRIYVQEMWDVVHVKRVFCSTYSIRIRTYIFKTEKIFESLRHAKNFSLTIRNIQSHLSQHIIKSKHGSQNDTTDRSLLVNTTIIMSGHAFISCTHKLAVKFKKYTSFKCNTCKFGFICEHTDHRKEKMLTPHKPVKPNM